MEILNLRGKAIVVLLVAAWLGGCATASVPAESTQRATIASSASADEEKLR